MNRLQEFTRWLLRRKPKSSVVVVTSVAIDMDGRLKHMAKQVAVENQPIRYEGEITLAPKLQKIAKLTGVRIGGKYHALPEPIIVQPGDHVLIVFGGPSMKDDNP